MNDDSSNEASAFWHERESDSDGHLPPRSFNPSNPAQEAVNVSLPYNQCEVLAPPSEHFTSAVVPSEPSTRPSLRDPDMLAWAFGVHPQPHISGGGDNTSPHDFQPLGKYVSRMVQKLCHMACKTNQLGCSSCPT